MIRGSGTGGLDVYIYIWGVANSELHDHRGFKPRLSWLESTKRFVWWSDDIRALEPRRISLKTTWSQATIKFHALKRRYFSPCKYKFSTKNSKMKFVYSLGTFIQILRANEAIYVCFFNTNNVVISAPTCSLRDFFWTNCSLKLLHEISFNFSQKLHFSFALVLAEGVRLFVL